MKKLHLFIALAATFLAAGCAREQGVSEPEPIIPKVVKGVPVSVTMSVEPNGDEAKTKSVISLDATDFKSAYLFAFEVKPSGPNPALYEHKTIGSVTADFPLAIFIEEKSFTWDLPVGLNDQSEYTKMNLYAIVNPDETVKAALDEMMATPMSEKTLMEADMNALQLVITGENFRAFEENGMPMSGISKDVILYNDDDVLAFTLKRLFARYEIRLDVSDFPSSEWEVKAASIFVARSNKKVDYFYTGSGAGSAAQSVDDLIDLDSITTADSETINDFDPNGISKNAITLFIPENCQGNIGGATSWDKVWIQKFNETALCSRIQIIFTALKDNIEHTLNYYLYPGSNNDMRSNFDVIRNSYKKLTLKLTPGKSNQFEWREDIAGHSMCAPGETVQVPFETVIPIENITFVATPETGVTCTLGAASLISDAKLSELHIDKKMPSGSSVYFIPVTVTSGKLNTFPMQSIILKAKYAEEEKPTTVLVGEDDEFFQHVDILYRAEYISESSVMDLGYYFDYTGTAERCQIDLQAGTGDPFDPAAWNPIDNTDARGHFSMGNARYHGNGNRGTDAAHLYYAGDTEHVFIYGYPQVGVHNRITVSVPILQEFDGSLSYKTKVYDFESGKRPVMGLLFKDKVRNRSELLLPGGENIILLKSGESNKYYLYPVLLDPDTHEEIMSENLINGQAFKFAVAGDYQMPGVEVYNGTENLCHNEIMREQRVKGSKSGSMPVNIAPINLHDEAERCCDSDYIALNTTSGTMPFNAGKYIRVTYGRYSEFEPIYEGSIDVFPEVKLTVDGKGIRLQQAKKGEVKYSKIESSGKDMSLAEKENGFWIAPGLTQTFFVTGCEHTPTVENINYIGGPCSILPSVNFTSLGDGVYRMDVTIDEPTSSEISIGSSFGGYGVNTDSHDHSVISEYEITITDSETSETIGCRALWAKSILDFNYDYTIPTSEPSAFSGADTQGRLKLAAFNPLGCVFDVKTEVAVTEKIRVYWWYSATSHNDRETQNSGKTWEGSITKKDFCPSSIYKLIEGSNTTNLRIAYDVSWPLNRTPQSINAYLRNAACEEYKEAHQLSGKDVPWIFADIYLKIVCPEFGYHVRPVPVKLDLNMGFDFKYFEQAGLNFGDINAIKQVWRTAALPETYFIIKENPFPNGINYKWFGEKRYFATWINGDIEWEDGLFYQNHPEWMDGINDYFKWEDEPLDVDGLHQNTYAAGRFQHDYLLNFRESYTSDWDQFEMYSGSMLKYNYYQHFMHPTEVNEPVKKNLTFDSDVNRQNGANGLLNLSLW